MHLKLPQTTIDTKVKVITQTKMQQNLLCTQGGGCAAPCPSYFKGKGGVHAEQVASLLQCQHRETTSPYQFQYKEKLLSQKSVSTSQPLDGSVQ